MLSLPTTPNLVTQAKGAEDTHARSSDFGLRQKVAEDIRHACLTAGFFYVKNHGIPEELPLEAVERSKAFWDLPEKKKLETPLLSANVNPANRGDLYEKYGISWEDENGNSGVREGDGAMLGQNIWPADMPEFRTAMLNYYHAAVKLGQALFPLFALALNLPEKFFDDKTTNTAAMLRILHYPPQTGVVDDGVMGIGAHTE
ncbi:hypothetical protein Clacol_009739 [Clathrus columnatus]|uniref:Non-haem dioxygenase N-terminal domain-containing protein n=1 Tax=Clathrus columnatus TaxID=1419009 RepID=A0AAV5ARJ6_9AGAM|nr:hypothetical protein Clacol_009739 [Clathrus columnatus]